MTVIMIQRRHTKEKITGLGQYPIVRITACLCLILSAISLFTPYPAEVIRALKGQNTPQKELPAIAPVPTSPQKIPAVTPSPEKKEPSSLIDPDLVKPWSLDRSCSTPTVQYPPFPPVMPTRPSPNALWNVQELARGINLKTQVKFREGSTASIDRTIPSNYRATLTYDIALPKALTKSSQLTKLNPSLRSILPGLDELMNHACISPYFSQIYSRKQQEIRKKLVQLNRVLDRHNFYDTETILEITAPQTGRKLLWLQSEMDVVSDGSDGDRLATMPDKVTKSSFYQPSTSYRWKKRSDQPNPLLSIWEKRLKDATANLPKASASEKSDLRNRINHAKRVINELKRYSFLIAEYDPFIVMPLGVVNQNTPFSPSFGDYAVVIVDNCIYPSIVGDAGPRYKTGEASLRLASTINPKANSYSRPISDLKVSYLIFPGTAPETNSPPDYKVWKQKCEELLKEIGGLGVGYTLHEWEDLLTPPPAPSCDTKNTSPLSGITAHPVTPTDGAMQTTKPASSDNKLQNAQSSSSDSDKIRREHPSRSTAKSANPTKRAER